MLSTLNNNALGDPQSLLGPLSVAVHYPALQLNYSNSHYTQYKDVY